MGWGLESGFGETHRLVLMSQDWATARTGPKRRISAIATVFAVRSLPEKKDGSAAHRTLWFYSAQSWSHPDIMAYGERPVPAAP